MQHCLHYIKSSGSSATAQQIEEDINQLKSQVQELRAQLENTKTTLQQSLQNEFNTFRAEVLAQLEQLKVQKNK